MNNKYYELLSYVSIHNSNFYTNRENERESFSKSRTLTYKNCLIFMKCWPAFFFYQLFLSQHVGAYTFYWSKCQPACWLVSTHLEWRYTDPGVYGVYVSPLFWLCFVFRTCFMCFFQKALISLILETYLHYIVNETCHMCFNIRYISFKRFCFHFKKKKDKFVFNLLKKLRFYYKSFDYFFFDFLFLQSWFELKMFWNWLGVTITEQYTICITQNKNLHLRKMKIKF